MYNNWYQYNSQGFCCSSTELHPDLQTSAGMMPIIYGEVSSLHGKSSTPAIRRIDILASHILCYNNYALTFFAEEHEFKILFYAWDDSHGIVYTHELIFNHSPRKEDDDDAQDGGDDEVPGNKKNLDHAVYGTPIMGDNQNPPPDGLNDILKELMKCVLTMESRVSTMLQEFDASGDHFATKDHTLQRHDFPTKKRSPWWLKDDQGAKCAGNPDNIYVFNHMLRKARAPQAPLQGPVPGTSGTDQPPVTAGTSQYPNPGTSHVPTH